MDIELNDSDVALIIRHDDTKDGYSIEVYHNFDSEDLDTENKFFYATLVRGLAYLATHSEEELCMHGAKLLLAENGYENSDIEKFETMVNDLSEEYDAEAEGHTADILHIKPKGNA